MQSDIEVNELASFDINGRDDTASARIQRHVSEAFEKIAPFWPLKNLIAVNPLKGFENIPFEQAINEGIYYFQQNEIPVPLQDINRETIKWCQAFFDEGQATIKMPFRDQGLYQCFKRLATHDSNLNQLDANKLNFLSNLPATPEQAILLSLNKLEIRTEEYGKFLLLLLTTLPGWASHVSYKTEWSHAKDQQHPVTQAEYLALRSILAYLLWPNGIDIYHWYYNSKAGSGKINMSAALLKITENENRYQALLLKSIANNKHQPIKTDEIPNAQLVFCIDVRSEPFRRAIESQGNYETFSFAGFFGIPALINNELCESTYASCPVLLPPKHQVHENIYYKGKLKRKLLRKRQHIKILENSYQMLKYMFTTPFNLVEILGAWSALWMLTRTIAPMTATRFKREFLDFPHDHIPVSPVLNSLNELNGIDFTEQCSYALNFLRMIGLTKKFAPLIILCAHGANTENNAYHSALDCGACGGRSGAPNARILAAILNSDRVRIYLAEKNIRIPEQTVFIPALHNTTTDEIKFYNIEHLTDSKSFEKLRSDLLLASEINIRARSEKLLSDNTRSIVRSMKRRSSDWAQTRPEWGLARNASFIVGPRTLTRDIDLDGRAFLHSYDWEEDKDGALLTTILTAPMIVAQWINCQYLFSTLDNVSYGSGSKITHNITGKIGIIQGNASDLMHGLSLQSVYKSDHEQYHEPIRLMTVVYAPRSRIETIISKEVILQKLFKNAWVYLKCIDPVEAVIYSLTTDLKWQTCNATQEN